MNRITTLCLAAAAGGLLLAPAVAHADHNDRTRDRYRDHARDRVRVVERTRDYGARHDRQRETNRSIGVSISSEHGVRLVYREGDTRGRTRVIVKPGASHHERYRDHRRYDHRDRWRDGRCVEPVVIRRPCDRTVVIQRPAPRVIRRIVVPPRRTVVVQRPHREVVIVDRRSTVCLPPVHR